MAMADKTTVFLRVPEFQPPKGSGPDKIDWLARILFAFNLFEARAQEEGKPLKFGCTLVFPIAVRPFFGEKITKLIRDTPGANWGEKGLQRFKDGLIKNPVLKGDGKEARDSNSGELKIGMGPEFCFIRPTANHTPDLKYKPWVRNEKNLPASQAEVYSGCYGVPVLTMYSYNHPKSGDGISINISGFQKYKNGEPIGGAGSDPDKWAESIADEGAAPDATKTGAGASGLFSD